MSPAGTTVVGYVRVSSIEQGRSGLGLEAQRRAIRAECKRRGWKLDRIEEDVASGATRRRRPGLDAALASCQSGEVAGVVVAKLDRLTRSLTGFAAILEKARKHRYNVVAIDLGLDLSSPQGELVAHVLASVAQWERRTIGERTTAALQAKRDREPGWKPGPDPVIPVHVRRKIVRLRRSGLGTPKIAAALNADGVATAHGGKEWYPSTVRKVLVDAGVWETRQ